MNTYFAGLRVFIAGSVLLFIGLSLSSCASSPSASSPSSGNFSGADEGSAARAEAAAARAEAAAARAEALFKKPGDKVVKVAELKKKTVTEENLLLHLKGDPQLNYYQGNPHTLSVCIYHLRDHYSFRQVLEDKEGVSKLLECSRFDPSVAYVKRVVIQPGREVTEALDWTEGIKYFAVVAGYFSINKDAVRIFEAPIIEEKRGNVIVAKPESLDIDLYLGPKGITEIKGRK